MTLFDWIWLHNDFTRRGWILNFSVPKIIHDENLTSSSSTSVDSSCEFAWTWVGHLRARDFPEIDCSEFSAALRLWYFRKKSWNIANTQNLAIWIPQALNSCEIGWGMVGKRIFSHAFYLTKVWELKISKLLKISRWEIIMFNSSNVNFT